MARTNRLRKYHALQAEQNKLEYPHYDYTCENVRKLQQNDASCNQIIRYIEQSTGEEATVDNTFICIEGQSALSLASKQA
jgi:hypothetical protein